MKPSIVAKKEICARWFCGTAALASKRATALSFSPKGDVFGIVPDTGASVCVYYPRPGGEDFVATVLESFPKGAVFPASGSYGGSSCAKALRPYGRVPLPESGGTVEIDPVTRVIRVNGAATVVKSAGLSEESFPIMLEAPPASRYAFADHVSADVGKLLGATVRKESTQPFKSRVLLMEVLGEKWLTATSGTDAVFVKMPYDAPDDFNCDPSVAPPRDVEAFGSSVTQTGKTVRSFLMSDGCLIVEATAENFASPLKGFAETVFGNPDEVFLSAETAKSVYGRVSAIGASAGSCYGGQLLFTPSGITLFSDKGPVVEFEDACQGIPCSRPLRYSVDAIASAVSVGGDLRAQGDGILVVESGGVRYVSAPMRAS